MRRRVLCMVLALVMVCLWYVIAEGNNNLVINPSFEADDGSGSPTDWKVDVSAPILIGMNVTDEVAASGDKSLMTIFKAAALGEPKIGVTSMQYVNVEPNKVYKVSFKYQKKDVVAERSRILMLELCKEENGTWERIIYTEPPIMWDHDLSGEWSDQGYRVVMLDSKVSEDHGEWKESWVVIKTTEETSAIALSFAITVWKLYKPGKIYFDDVVITQIQ